MTGRVGNNRYLLVIFSGCAVRTHRFFGRSTVSFAFQFLWLTWRWYTYKLMGDREHGRLWPRGPECILAACMCAFVVDFARNRL